MNSKKTLSDERLAEILYYHKAQRNQESSVTIVQLIDEIARLKNESEKIKSELKEWRRLRPIAKHWIWSEETTSAQAIIDRIDWLEKKLLIYNEVV